MAERLPQRQGEWIDRAKQLHFRFEGYDYNGYAGDTLTSALVAAGLRRLGRSFKYHRPRGVYSMAAHDVNVMVEDVGQGQRRTNLRADLLPLVEGLDVRAVNTRGGVTGDRLRFIEKFAKFMPVGFYYKEFYSPKSLFPFYEKKMREVAGLGELDPEWRVSPTPKAYDFCDVLVIGGGPSGLSAAVAAAEQGLDVVLVDENPRLGGSLTDIQATRPEAPGILQELTSKAQALTNLRIHTSTTAAGAYADFWIALVDEKKLTKMRARSVVVTTGAIEQPAVFHNNDLPGVMLGTAALRLIHRYAVKPAKSAVVMTANEQGYRTAIDLHDAGVHVAAITDMRVGAGGERADQSMHDALDKGIAVHRQHVVYEGTRGDDDTISGAVICPLDSSGEVDANTVINVACDSIITSTGWMPNGGLLYQSGGRFSYAEHVHQFVPSELPDGLFAGGRVNGVFELNAKLADGHRAGLDAASYLGKYEHQVPARQHHIGPPPSHPYPIISHPDGKNFVDLDEDLHLADFENAHQEGYDNIELMKRYTTFGMGASQGKISNMNAVRILAALNGATIDETGTTTSRPFYQPVEVEHLAGRRFHPHRHTPMHHWHESRMAHFMHVGPWLRPEYYGVRGQSREDAILNEARNVREKVGIVDVGTLGKIEVMGPDACAFLSRIYTGKFDSLAVGKMRYCLACDESGIIIDDGIVARLSDKHYYVTATTSGAAAFFREMQRWALLWQLDVILTNATGQFAAMNVAGPESRKVLSKLTGENLSPEAFPFVGVRQASVAGVPARIMRVGFVGELGYEVHVPTASGLAVWEAICAAGSEHGILPFGVEAQRLLRLEKGHIIVGQDTDSLANPYEADVAWALGKDKPFYVGQRTLQVYATRQQTRKLVGFFISGEAAPMSMPKECHLVIDKKNQIAGRITSIAPRSTLGRALGLAYVRPDQSEPGTKFRVKVDGGYMVDCEVTTLPFYDAENLRQKG